MDLANFGRESLDFIRYLTTSSTTALPCWLAIGALLLLIFRRASVHFVWTNLHLVQDLVLQKEFMAKADWALKLLFITLAFFPFIHFLPEWPERVLTRLALIIISFSTLYVIVQALDLLVFGWYFTKRKDANVPSVIRVVSLSVLYFIFGLIFLEFALGVNLLPLIATSTILTAVLGLSLQDTLKNVFAGITLSFEKRFRQGDWITFRLDPNNTTTGQVVEIGWRTTKIKTLEQTFSVIPNSMFATNHLINYSNSHESVYMRSVEIQAPLRTPLEKCVPLLCQAALRVDGVLKEPPPDVIASAIKIDQIALRVRFNISDFSKAEIVSSTVIRECLKELEQLELVPSTSAVTDDKSK